MELYTSQYARQEIFLIDVIRKEYPTHVINTRKCIQAIHKKPEYAAAFVAKYKMKPSHIRLVGDFPKKVKLSPKKKKP